MPKLRGHHLICLHFYDGEGYDQPFVDNLRQILKTLREEDVEVVAGGDDVCSKCPHLRDDACQFGENADGDIRDMDMKALELLGFAVGNSVSWAHIQKVIPAIMTEWSRCYCIDCDWLHVCEKSKDFTGVFPGER